MAQRPVFVVSAEVPHFKKELITFQFFSGFAQSQKRKSIESLHTTFLQTHPQERVLEISSMSEDEIGVKLSAFNLEIKTLDGRRYSVESAFQSSKVFEHGGPYKDLLGKSSREAKKDSRLKTSGALKAFYFSNKQFSLQPETYFYNWLYIHALDLHPELSDKIMEYTAFTDIAFNPEKAKNCQACAAAVYVSLKKSGMLAEALEDPKAFLQIVYGIDSREKEKGASNTNEQITMW